MVQEVIVTKMSDREVFNDLVEMCAIDEHPVFFYYVVNEYGEESGKVGCGYEDGSFSVVGLGRDYKCSVEDMINIVYNSL